MNEQEKQACIFYADLKKMIAGKFIRTIEYEFSNERERIKNRTDLLPTHKDTIQVNLIVLESTIKNELKNLIDLK